MVQIHSPRPPKTFWAERIFEWFEHPSFQIEVSQIILHKADQPDLVVDFLDTDGLSSKDLTEIDFFPTQADAPAPGHHDRFIVEGLVDVRQSGRMAS